MTVAADYSQTPRVRNSNYQSGCLVCYTNHSFYDDMCVNTQGNKWECTLTVNIQSASSLEGLTVLIIAQSGRPRKYITISIPILVSWNI